MMCTCGAPTIVRDSRPTGEGFIRRRRRCDGCGRRFTTLEIPVDDSEDSSAKYNSVLRTYALLEAMTPDDRAAVYTIIRRLAGKEASA